MNNIIKLKCSRCGTEFAIDESNIKEDDTYLVKCPHCGNDFYRRKPVSDLGERKGCICSVKCLIAIIWSVIQTALACSYLLLPELKSAKGCGSLNLSDLSSEPISPFIGALLLSLFLEYGCGILGGIMGIKGLKDVSDEKYDDAKTGSTLALVLLAIGLFFDYIFYALTYHGFSGIG